MEQEMKYIYTVYKEQNFSAAAEKLYITQSALSMAVKRVESRLGEPIFDRSKRPIRLTPAGKIYIQKYYEIRQLENELVEQIHDLNNLKTGNLTIGGTQYLFSYILAPILLKFKTEYPSINLELFECSADKLSGKLLDGSIDIALKCDDYCDPLISCGRAFQDNLFLSLPKDYAAKYGIEDIGLTKEQVCSNAFSNNDFPYLEMKYLEKFPIVSLTSGNNLQTRLMNLFQTNNLNPTVSMKVQQMVTAHHLSNNGLGATLTSAHIISQSTEKKALYYKLDSEIMVRDFEFIINKRRYLSKSMEKFIELTREAYL